jgi:hypothetical protein
MSHIMVGSLFLILASASTASAVPPASEHASAFRPVTSATAIASASIRVISGVRFGSDYATEATAGTRRKARLTDSTGQPRNAELLEFQ